MADFFTPVKSRTEELLKDERALLKILEEGSAKAREVAAKTLKNAYDALGLVPGK